MAEKKATTKATATKTAATKTTTKKATTTKKCAAKVEIIVDAENAGFRAGDVYQALATEAKALTVAEIAKAATISTEEVLVGMGWLFKEGKIKAENEKVVLA